MLILITSALQMRMDKEIFDFWVIPSIYYLKF